MKNLGRNLLTLAFTGILPVIMASCTNDIENRGYVSKFSDFSKIKAGVSTKYDVIQELGSPTTTSLYGDETWYYIGKEQTKETFFRPETKSYDGYAITFSGDVVKSINKKDQTALKDVDVSDDFTKTSGNAVTVWQQLFGNLGKFDPASKQGVQTGVTPGGQGKRRY